MTVDEFRIFKVAAHNGQKFTTRVIFEVVPKTPLPEPKSADEGGFTELMQRCAQETVDTRSLLLFAIGSVYARSQLRI